MTYYKNLKSLFAAIQKDTRETMADEVYETVVDVQQEEIVEEVYNAYQPYQYSRRGISDGLMDRDNNIATLFTVNGGMQMLVQNIAKGQDSGEYITPLIVGGHGTNGQYYDYTKNRDNTQDRYLAPRDFISSSVDRMKRTLEHVESFKSGMQKKGYKFYK